MHKDPWDRQGVIVADHWSEGGGYEIFKHEEKFYLYEIPQYGGDPWDSGIFDTLEDAIKEGKTFT
jgi:hypothetical protein